MTRLGALFATLVIIASCSGATGPSHSSASPGAVDGGSVVIALGGDWQTLDLQKTASGDFIGSQIFLAMADRLIALGPKGATDLMPYLATSWDATATTAKFLLRKDATCSDGTPVTPTVVASSLKRFFDPALKSSNPRRLFGPGPVSVTADDAASMVTVTLGTPWSNFVTGFANPVTGIVCPATLADPSMFDAGNPVTSGPYTIVSVARGDAVKLKLRPEWKWGPNNTTASTVGMPKNLTFRVIANPTTRANALISGDVDIAYVNGPDEQRIEADKRFIHKTTYTLTSDAILFNHLAGHPTADDAVRQAVMTVIDQNAWNQAAHNGQGVLTPTFVSPGGDCFDPDASKLLPTTSIGAAQKVLENAGWSLVSGKLMKDGKPLVIRITSFSATGAGPEYLAAQLAQLGVTPVLEVGDVSALTAKLANGDFDIATSTQNALTDNPAWAFQTYYGPPPPQGTNWGRTPNRPDMDQTLAAAISTSGTERCSQWRVLQEALLKNHDYLPVGAARYDWFSPNFEFTATATLFEPYSLRRVK